ncbi:redox-regulated ATPase YchF, partial [Shewanella sp. C32]|nr:redox-regulated ATPase YchF [Shewanella electrica]
MAEEEVLVKIKEALEEERPARTVEFSDEQARIAKGLHLLTAKPVLYVANVGEDEVADSSDNELVQRVRDFASNEGAEVIVVCAK